MFRRCTEDAHKMITRCTQDTHKVHTRHTLTMLQKATSLIENATRIENANIGQTNRRALTKDIIYYRELMNEVGWPIKEPTLIQKHNKFTIHMAQDAGSHKNTQQILVKVFTKNLAT
jgi:hypothetical protein